MATVDSRRRELGDFLRSRRERVTPAEAGLTVTGRRRTPGLRREEVAALAGVGVTWYTWLEQGRAINASSQVLQAICRTLRLDEAETAHVRDLAGLQRPVGDPAPDVDLEELRRVFQPVLDKLDPYPAVIQDTGYTVLAYNRAYRFLIDDFDAYPADDRNCLKLFFTRPEWRAAYCDPEIVAVRMVARFRAIAGPRIGDPEVAALVDELCAASPEFRELWGRHDILVRSYDVKRMISNRVGLLQMSFAWSYIDAESGIRMSTMTPADDLTASRLELLAQKTADEPERLHTLAG